MNDLDTLVEQLREATAKVPGLILRITEESALGALALVDNRITETGIDAKGSLFKDYTPEYKRRKAGVTIRKPGRTQASIEKARSKGLSGLAKGRYKGFVDFNLSGQMLASTTTGFERIEPTEKTISNGTAKVSFDGRDDVTKKKLEGNNNYRPGFLNPSKEEIDRVTKSANDSMREALGEIVTVR